MSDLLICLDLDAQQAVQSRRSQALAQLRFVQGDTPRIVLRGLRNNSALTALAGDPYVESPIPYTDLTCGLTLVDAKPTGGSVILSVGGTQADAIVFDEDKASLAAKLNALANVIAAGGLTIIAGGASNIYRVLWVTPANALPITVVKNSLSPLSQVRINVDDSIPGKVNVKFMRAPVAFTSDFSLPAPPPVQLSDLRAGSGVRNAVQRLIIPANAVGGFTFTVSGFETQIIPVSGVTAAALAGTLNALFLGAPAFSVTGASGTFDLEFIGQYAKTAQALLPVQMFDQAALDTPAAFLPLTGIAIEDLLDTSAIQQVIFEVTAIDEVGRETTLAHQLCTIINDGIDAGTAGFIEAVATRVETVTVYPAATDPAVIAMIGQKFLPPVTGQNFTFTHDFGTEEIDVVVIRKRSVAPDHWGQYDDTFYDWHTLNANQVQLIFQQDVQAGGLGSVQVWVRTMAATPIVNDHRHSTDAIDGVGADDGHTLTQIIAELRNALPDGWPNIPANKLDGQLSPSQLDLAALAVALQGEPRFLTALQALITNGTIMDSIATALGTNAKFVATLATLMSNSTVLSALVAALGTSADFLTKLGELLIAALQNGGALPAGTVLMVIPDLVETFPAPEPRGSDDARGPRFQPVPVPIFTPTDAGNFAGQFGDPLSQAGKVFTIVGSASSPTANGRRQVIFADAAKVCCDGRLFFAGRNVGSSSYYPQELERVLVLLETNETMFAASTRFATKFSFSLATLGGLVGRYRFTLELGSALLDSADPAGFALQAITWNATPIDVVLNLSSVGIFHTFGYSVQRANDGTLGTAQKTLYGKTSATNVLPASARFFLRAQLTNFDATNSADPRGAIVLSLRGAVASIVNL